MQLTADINELGAICLWGLLLESLTNILETILLRFENAAK